MSANPTQADLATDHRLPANEESPLSGLRVVEITSDSFGAMVCGRMLAELGADVVMIEPSGGHPYRQRDTKLEGLTAGTFKLSARGKRSFVPDLGTPAGREELSAMIGDADVLLVDIESYRMLERMGANHFTDQASLVVCCISPFGLHGPYANMPGSELTVQALAGVLATNGEPDDEPIAIGVPVAAYGGAFYGLISILAAIYERMDSGKGRVIDQSEFDAVVSFQGTLIPGYFLTGEQFKRVGNRHTMTAPWNTFPTKDGWVVIATAGDEQWQRLARTMERPDLAIDGRFLLNLDRVRNVEILDEQIREWTVTLTTHEILMVLERADVPASSVPTLSEALNNPQAVHRIVRKGEGTAMPRLPFQLDRSTSWRWGKAPSPDTAEQRWVTERFPAGNSNVGPKSGPLTGVKVIDIGILTAGPLVGRILALLGADVIKVEPPGGERTRRVSYQVGGTGYLYHLNNTDKRGITVDSNDPRDTAIVKALCESIDVLLTNVGEKSLAGMGLDSKQLRVTNPGLIHCAVSGYGGSGPDRGRKAFDMVIQAQSGIMALTGPRNGRPTKVALSIVDIMSALSGAAGILAALIARRRDGHGQAVDTSLLDAGVWMTQCSWPTIFEQRGELHRVGTRSSFNAPHGCFKTLDGTIALDIRDDTRWVAWLKLANQDDLIDDPRYATARDRLSQVDEVEHLAATWARSKPTAELVQACKNSGIAAAPLTGLASAVEHPLAASRKMVVTVKSSSAGDIRVVGCPMKMSGFDLQVRKAAPDLGADNEAVKNYVMEVSEGRLACASFRPALDAGDPSATFSKDLTESKQC